MSHTAKVPYGPAVSANWATIPSKANEALDHLATRTPKLKGASWDGGGSVIVAADCPEVNVLCNTAGTISRWTILTEGGNGSCVVDVWKTTYASAPPTVANTITAAAKPTVSSATKAQSSTLTGWTTTVAAGDVMTFKLDSNSIFTAISVFLEIL